MIHLIGTLGNRLKHATENSTFPCTTYDVVSISTLCFSEKTPFLSVLFREGKEWKEQRTVLNKYLLRSSVIAPYSGAINSVCEDLLDKIRTIILSTNQESAIINFSSVLFNWSLEGWAFYFATSSLRGIEFYVLSIKFIFF